MNPAQKAIADLARTRDISKLKLREIGAIIGVDKPQTVKYHLDTLLKRGVLGIDNKGSVRAIDPNNEKAGLIKVPILGEANCGEALIYAEDDIRGFLPVSPSMLSVANYNDVFCVIAVGRSMNAANVNGKSIEDGDFVIAQKQNPFSYGNGDYIVATFEGRANVKKFIKDEANRCIILQSESLDLQPPIYIAEDDIGALQIHGKVINILHSPQNTNRQQEYA